MRPWPSATLTQHIRLVLERQRGPAGQAEPDRLLSREANTARRQELPHGPWALPNWRRYSKGHHRAQPSPGDCCSHGLARALAAPWLFKGGDLAATDNTAVLPS